MIGGSGRSVADGRPQHAPPAGDEFLAQPSSASATTTRATSRAVTLEAAVTLSPSTNDILDRIRGTIAGEVIGPDDPAYEAARQVLYGVDSRPAAIARVANTQDIAAVLGLARERDLEVAVRSGGHSSAGHGTTDGGIVIDLGALKDIDLDVDGRTVWAGTGLTAAELGAAVGEHGLVIGFGDTGSVGIGGITNGGGIGFLVRKY